jgi:alpha-galactosidase
MLGLGCVLATVLFIPARFSTNNAAAFSDLARTPPMGWNSWNRFGCLIDEWKIKRIADGLVSSGMRDAGYRYLVIDDCWQAAKRDANGDLTADPLTFPSGMQALGDYIRERGLKFGIYTGAGKLSCMGRPGSLGYETRDAARFAAWGADYVKIDWCYTDGLDARKQFATWREAINATGRPMTISICTWGEQSPWDWGRESGHLWRTTGDISDRWPVILDIIRQNAPLAYAAGPGGWNDPDMLEVGNGPLTLTMNRSHFALWAMMAAPLIAGNDVSRMRPEIAAILLNREIIAVDQDPLGVAALIYRDDDGPQVWARPLADGSHAVALFNPRPTASTMAVRWNEVGMPGGPALVRDLWAQSDLGTLDELSVTVEPYDTLIYRVRPATQQPPPPPPPTEPAPPAVGLPPSGVSHLSALEWMNASNFFGPVERDASNGEAAAGDGLPLTINGTSYQRGLGVHAPSEVSYQLGGQCSVLAAEIGIDDEVGDNGAVIFQVWGDGQLLYDSGVITGAMPATPLYIGLDGVQALGLVVRPASDSTDYAHANWADARIECR